MPRRGNVPKREILPDPLYNSVLVTKLVNSIMLDGKKGVAQKVVYGAFDIIKDKTGKEPLEVFTTAIENIMPSLETKSRRVGGSTYQVPMEVRPERRQTLGLRWLTSYSRNRGEKTMKERLAGEIMDAASIPWSPTAMWRFPRTSPRRLSPSAGGKRTDRAAPPAAQINSCNFCRYRIE